MVVIELMIKIQMRIENLFSSLSSVCHGCPNGEISDENDESEWAKMATFRFYPCGIRLNSEIGRQIRQRRIGNFRLLRPLSAALRPLRSSVMPQQTTLAQKFYQGQVLG